MAASPSGETSGDRAILIAGQSFEGVDGVEIEEPPPLSPEPNGVGCEPRPLLYKPPEIFFDGTPYLSTAANPDWLGRDLTAMTQSVSQFNQLGVSPRIASMIGTFINLFNFSELALIW